MENKPRFIAPLLVVEDIDRARTFYNRVLELEVIQDFGENITFEGNFSLHLRSHFQQLIGGLDVKTGGNDGEIYFEFDDLESLDKRLKSMQVEYVHPLREQPWRQRVVRFYDPDHHIIEVGESFPCIFKRLEKDGLPYDEIARVTLMPVDYVESCLKQEM
jgi:catechol 2,3-dioxygenase-like lactoylglutathione lyase family enzyme